MHVWVTSSPLAQAQLKRGGQMTFRGGHMRTTHKRRFTQEALLSKEEGHLPPGSRGHTQLATER